jgi:hypothetical protein
MGGDFKPFRRDVSWWQSQDAPIHPLLGELNFAEGRGWGAKLRFGLIEVGDADMDVIERAMRA